MRLYVLKDGKYMDSKSIEYEYDNFAVVGEYIEAKAGCWRVDKVIHTPDYYESEPLYLVHEVTKEEIYGSDT